MYVVVTRATNIAERMGSQSCMKKQYALDLSGNVGTELGLGQKYTNRRRNVPRAHYHVEVSPQKFERGRYKMVATARPQDRIDNLRTQETSNRTSKTGQIRIQQIYNKNYPLRLKIWQML